ncbi:MAG: DAK2 domain-containing protein [Eubacterium sp.]|nr:DAK2 domain-containing protein [Eubacterium sp.]
MFLAGAGRLESRKEYINDLNVFPVPDGDTGTNMTMTILSAASEVNAIEDPDLKSLSKAISTGSLRGARGNSGVILSQLLRGFSRTIADADTLDVPLVADAFGKAVETAYKAVMKPKEGTILTVAREVSEKAREMADKTDDFVVFGEEVIKTADETLQKTPELLSVLKEAGVVDSGGQGLLEFLSGCYDVVLGKEIDYAATVTAPASPRPVKISAQTEEEIKFGYCTEFIIVLNRPLTDDEITDFKKFLNGIGDSIVFVPDDEIVKIHVHTNDPGDAIQKALGFGSLSKIKIDNMREEHQERLFKDSLKLAAQQKEEEDAKKDEPPKDFGFVTVCAGDGLKTIFEDLGADYVISGGQTMNPSTDDITRAAESVNAKTVFVLPNNKNIILAANQAADLIEDKKIIVVPTTNVPQGITALVNFVPDMSAEENLEHMNEGRQFIKTAEVTYAVRDTTIEGVEIKENDFMAIGDNGLLAAEGDIKTAVSVAFDKLLDEDSEIISIYYGEDVTEEAAQEILEIAEEKGPDCDVELYSGGQPVYSYFISVE